jgi:hypothetical protein
LNHFTVPCSLLTAVLFSVDRFAITLEPGRIGAKLIIIELSGASTPNPSTELRAVFGGFLATRQAGNKKGRKFDLATAFTSKGDTRATNA